MRHAIVALTRCISAIDSLGVLDCLQLFHTPVVQVRLRRLQACNARSKKRREGEPQLVQVRLRRLQACNARSKKRREGEEVGT